MEAPSEPAVASCSRKVNLNTTVPEKYRRERQGLSARGGEPYSVYTEANVLAHSIRFLSHPPSNSLSEVVIYSSMCLIKKMVKMPNDRFFLSCVLKFEFKFCFLFISKILWITLASHPLSFKVVQQQEQRK